MAASLCRLCLSTEDVSADIFQGRSDEEPLSAFFWHNFRIQLEEKTRWPTSACRQCIKQISQIKKFKKKVESTQNALNLLINIKTDDADPPPRPANSRKEKDTLNDDGHERPSLKTEQKDEKHPIPPDHPEYSPPPSPIQDAAAIDEDSDVSSILSSFDYSASSPEPVSTKIRFKKKRSGPYTCEKCGKVVTTKTSLENHILTHLDKAQRPKHVCVSCGKVFDALAYLRQHTYLVHRRRASEECPECHKFFFCLKGHLRVVHGIGGKVENATCPICHKSMKVGSLKTHVMSHEDPSLPCGECGKLFNAPEKLEKHSLMHTKIRSTCLFCPHTSLGWANVTNHMRKAHPEEYAAHKEKRFSVPEVRNGDAE